MLLFMMLTILFLAIPHICADLSPSSTQMLWIVDIYGFLMAGGFLVAMGTPGDRIGRRRLLTAGAQTATPTPSRCSRVGQLGWLGPGQCLGDNQC